MIEQRSWTVRPYRSGDEVHLAALFERVFERPMTPQLWRWKLGDHAKAPPNVWLAVDGQDRPLCQYAGIPRRVRLPDGEHTVMVAVDAMTAPELRRQGAFTAVVTRAHAAWRDAGVAFVLGMPNEEYGSRTDALGWQRVSSLRWMIRPIRPDVLLARRTRLGGLPGLEAAGGLWNTFWNLGARRSPGRVFEAMDRAESEAAFDRLAGARDSKEHLELHRDKAWMVHRLLDVPVSPYRIVVASDGQEPVGYAAYRVQEVNGRRIGAIAELVTPHPDSRFGSWLIREAADRLRDAGADIAVALAVPGSRDHRLFRRRGFLFSWGTFVIHAVILDPDIRIETLRGSGRWMLAGGDFDLI
ncbi:MAG: GNAT family N-acetyltransferase [Acidobacteria bacterium]|nr:GNAT family N-acetyltransferase [Acidobacteriota bacterium]